MSVIRQIEHECRHFNGRAGVFARNLETGETWAVNAEAKFPSASTIKLAVLGTLMQQVEDGHYVLEDPLMLRLADKVGGSGLLQHLTPGLTMPIRDWAYLMMNISDNSATNVLIDHVGLKNVQSWLAANTFEGIALHNKIDFPALGHDLYHFGTATPIGLNCLITAVFRRELVSETACDEMLRMMQNVGRERIGRYLPFEPFDAAMPAAEKLRLAGKTGSFKGCRAQTAVVWRGPYLQAKGFTIAVMTAGDPAPETWSVDAAGVLLHGRVARVVYEAVFTDA